MLISTHPCVKRVSVRRIHRTAPGTVLVERVTDWYAHDQKPARTGVYEVRVAGCELAGVVKAYWDGAIWREVSTSGRPLPAVGWEWRGLAEAPTR